MYGLKQMFKNHLYSTGEYAKNKTKKKRQKEKPKPKRTPTKKKKNNKQTNNSSPQKTITQEMKLWTYNC